MTIFITYNNKCSEGETTSAFNNLSNTVDETTFLVIRFLYFRSSPLYFLLLLEYQASFASSFSQGSYTAVVQIATTIEYNFFYTLSQRFFSDCFAYSFSSLNVAAVVFFQIFSTVLAAAIVSPVSSLITCA